MESSRPPPDVDALLAEREAVLRLARRLVRDTAQADDVAQDVMIAGLERGDQARGLGGWLSGVTRNLSARERRTSARRSKRERAVARREAQPATVDLVARAAEHRRLLESLEALGEPVRSMLLLRYFEDLPPRKIAARLDLPVATVKSRLRRGLAHLREQMDRKHGGDRRQWMAALAPSLGWGLAGAAGLGLGVLVGAKLKIAAATGVVLLLGLSAWRAWDPDDPSVPLETTEEAALLAAPKLEGADTAAPKAEPVAGPAPTSPSKLISFTFRGRVVDQTRQPAVGARVRVLWRGRSVSHAVADANGVYEIEAAIRVPVFTGSEPKHLSSYTSVAVWAHGVDGQVGVQQAPVRDTEHTDVDLTPIVLGPGHDVRVRVLVEGAPRSGATVLVLAGSTMRVQKTWLANVKSDDRGVVDMRGLPAGKFTVIALMQDRSPNAITVSVPEASEWVDIELPPRETIDVRVVEAGSETPVAGARLEVSVRPFPTGGPSWMGFDISDYVVAPTDASGHTAVVAFAEGVRLHVRAWAPHLPAPAGQGPHLAPAVRGTDTVTLQLPGASTIRWPIAVGEVDEPPTDGAPLTIRKMRNVFFAEGAVVPERGVVRDGHVVVDRMTPVTVDLELIAVTEDGRFAMLTAPKTGSLGPETTFARARTATVRVLEHDGTPAADKWVSYRDQPHGLAAHQRTGESGTVSLHPLLPEQVRVHVYHGRHRQFLGSIEATVDLSMGDQEVELRLPEPQALTIHVTVNEKPALPPSYSLGLGGLQLHERTAIEDATAGTLRFELYTPKPLVGERVMFRAFGMLPQYGMIESNDGQLTARVALDSRGLLEVSVRPPEDGKFKVALEQYADAYGRWYPRGKPVTALGQGRFVIGPLPQGKYRVRDQVSGAVSRPVALNPKAGAEAVDLDLTRGGIVEGVVRVPPGIDMNHVRIVMQGLPDAGGNWRARPQRSSEPPFREPTDAVRPALDGTFAVRVPGDSPITLRPWHPLLKPTRMRTLEFAERGVELSLERGPVTTITLAGTAPALGRRGPGTEVRLYRGEPAGEALLTTYPLIEDGRLRFGGYEPGVYTLWIDGGTQAPKVLPNQELGVDTRIENLSFGSGSTVRLKVLLPEGAPRPALRLRAQALDSTKKVRSTIVSALQKDDPVLTGLSSGRHDFLVRDFSKGSKIVLQQVIDVDGESEITVTLDMR